MLRGRFFGLRTDGLPVPLPYPTVGGANSSSSTLRVRAYFLAQQCLPFGLPTLRVWQAARHTRRVGTISAAPRFCCCWPDSAGTAAAETRRARARFCASSAAALKNQKRITTAEAEARSSRSARAH